MCSEDNSDPERLKARDKVKALEMSECTLSWKYLLTGFQLVPFSNWHESSHSKPLNWFANVVEIAEISRIRDARNYGKIAAKNTVLYPCWNGFPDADNWPNKIIAATNLSLNSKLKTMDTVNTQFVVFFTRVSIGSFPYVNLIK